MKKWLVGGAVVVVLIALGTWAIISVTPPPSKICGTPGGPPITAPRIRLSDGRHLAYQEHGVSRQNATFKIIFIHAFATFRRDAVIAQRVRPGFLEKNGIYIVSYDRPGYGESDPDPNRNEKTLARDVEQLADQLQLGSKFYVVGYSMGGQAVWGVLKYIPHRLAGATLLSPVTNSWWPSFPSSLTWELWNKQSKTERFGMLITHNTPWLLYWWNNQKLFETSSVMQSSPTMFSPQDMAVLPKLAARVAYKNQTTQQGTHESLDRDLIVGFGKWGFDPMKIENPFPKGEGSVHLWQGDDDRLVPVALQRIIAQKLTWIKYHEVPGAGHLFPNADGMGETVLKELLPIPQAS
ncbi:hypothetical protein EUTSA_v10010501mg [Eutrema salsugineum]|uniref:AB hydrolase-1 domain-containing protein n=1 Tax=Eutrema salsugineum TaxID=72664 RepID=V4LYS4_EUTSA|nr:uncharacterized protein LOC18021186 [Eutrema salsugineum]ESQ45053.1 hypothetical protein EUTSA_v10010501mg [Eutrema salsugineum]